MSDMDFLCFGVNFGGIWVFLPIQSLEMMDGGSTQDFKVVLLGQGCVGKTSIFTRFMFGQFRDVHDSTMHALSHVKRLNLPGGQRVGISLWDTAGQEHFHSLGPIYYRNAQGAILVYDITKRSSFERVQNWVEELRTMLGYGIHLVIAGNKLDLEGGRVVGRDEAESYANQVNAKHFMISAKDDRGIGAMFIYLSKGTKGVVWMKKKWIGR